MAVQGARDAHQTGNMETLMVGQMARALGNSLAGFSYNHFHYFTSGKGVFAEDFCPSLYFYNPRVQWTIQCNRQPDQLFTDPFAFGQ